MWDKELVVVSYNRNDELRFSQLLTAGAKVLESYGQQPTHGVALRFDQARRGDVTRAQVQEPHQGPPSRYVDCLRRRRAPLVPEAVEQPHGFAREGVHCEGPLGAAHGLEELRLEHVVAAARDPGEVVGDDVLR